MSSESSGAESLLLPERSILVHIGPFKTGSTAIQFAMHDARDAMAEHGVLYPGPRHRQMRPGWAIMGLTPPANPKAEIEEWDAFAATMRAADATRIAISTEDFGRANVRQAGKVVADLGADRVHVVAVARRFDNLLPSQWQERIRSCDETKNYEDWLREILGDDRSLPSAQPFWTSHDFIRTLDNWLTAISPEQMHVIVSDDSDRTLLPRTFESMLGLPEGLLVTRPRGENASLGYDRVELIRQVNLLLEQREWTSRDHHRMVQRGVVTELETVPDPARQQRIPKLPRWAAERAAEISDERIAAIKDRGVHVIGDPDRLRVAVPDDAPESLPVPESISIAAASIAVDGAAKGAQRLEKAVRRERAVSDDPREVGAMRTRELGRVLARRTVAAVRQQADKIRPSGKS